MSYFFYPHNAAYEFRLSLVCSEMGIRVSSSTCPAVKGVAIIVSRGMMIMQNKIISFFFKAEDGIRYRSPSRGLGEVYKRQPQLQRSARVFPVGDKVMQVRNNYEIVWQRIGGEQGVGAYNGDIGIVESINTRERSMVVRMDDRRLVYPAENLNELEIAYAITVHKSQGSEFPAVILPAAQVPPRLCYRNLFYTGVTRGRKLCIVVGRRDVVNRMMSNIRQNLRYSGLAALLAQALPPEQENL